MQTFPGVGGHISVHVVGVAVGAGRGDAAARVVVGQGHKLIPRIAIYKVTDDVRAFRTAKGQNVAVAVVGDAALLETTVAPGACWSAEDGSDSVVPGVRQAAEGVVIKTPPKSLTSGVGKITLSNRHHELINLC